MGKIRNPLYAILEPNTNVWEPINFGDLHKVFRFYRVPDGTTLPLAVFDVPPDLGPIEDYDACVLEGMVLEVGVEDQIYRAGAPVKWLQATWSDGRVRVTNSDGEEVT